jgi:hypothetical protein
MWAVALDLDVRPMQNVHLAFAKQGANRRCCKHKSYRPCDFKSMLGSVGLY